MAEGVRGRTVLIAGATSASGEAALALLEHAVAGSFSTAIGAYAGQRAAELAQDHNRVRAAGIGVARVSVEPVLPPDIIGLYVLLPRGA